MFSDFVKNFVNSSSTVEKHMEKSLAEGRVIVLEYLTG